MMIVRSSYWIDVLALLASTIPTCIDIQTLVEKLYPNLLP